MAILITSVKLDRWTINDCYSSYEQKVIRHITTYSEWQMDIHNIKYFGIWYICDYTRCIDSVIFVKYTILKKPIEEPIWLHLIRFLIVSSMVTIGFGIIVSVNTVINHSRTTSVAYVLNTLGLLPMVILMIYTLPTAKKNHLPICHQWSYSFTLSYVGISFGFVMSFVYTLKRLLSSWLSYLKNEFLKK